MIIKKIIHNCPTCNTKLVSEIKSEGIIIDSEISDYKISTVDKDTLKNIIKEASQKREIKITVKQQYLNINYGKTFIIQYAPFINDKEEGELSEKNLSLRQKKINKFIYIDDITKSAKISNSSFDCLSLSEIIKNCIGQNKTVNIKINNEKIAIVSNNKKHLTIEEPSVITKIILPYFKKLYGENELLKFIINKGSIYISDSEQRTTIKIQ